jgi:hypothetical protein
MNGSVRQRGARSWELCVYEGVDAGTGKRRCATRTARVPTKNRRRHRVDIDERTLSAVRRHRREVEARATAAGMPLAREAYVFSGVATGMVPWRPNWVTKTFIERRARRRAASAARRWALLAVAAWATGAEPAPVLEDGAPSGGEAAGVLLGDAAFGE